MLFAASVHHAWYCYKHRCCWQPKKPFSHRSIDESQPSLCYCLLLYIPFSKHNCSWEERIEPFIHIYWEARLTSTFFTVWNKNAYITHSCQRHSNCCLSVHLRSFNKRVSPWIPKNLVHPTIIAQADTCCCLRAPCIRTQRYSLLLSLPYRSVKRTYDRDSRKLPSIPNTNQSPICCCISVTSLTINKQICSRH